MLWWWLVLTFSLLSELPAAATAAAASKTLYSVLGVKPDASQDDLKRGYHMQAVKWHPDKNRENVVEAEERFKKIQQAYDTLKDPRKRREYDANIKGGSATSPGRPRSGDQSADGFFNSRYYTRTGAHAGTTRGQGHQERAGQYHWGWESSRYGADVGLEGFWRRLFDSFGLSSSEPELSPLQPPRWKNLKVKLNVSLLELLKGVEKDVQLEDSILERYKQALRTGLLSEVLQQGAPLVGALLLRFPLSTWEARRIMGYRSPEDLIDVVNLLRLAPSISSWLAFSADVPNSTADTHGLPQIPSISVKVPVLPGSRGGTMFTVPTPEGIDITIELVESPSGFQRIGDDLLVMGLIPRSKARAGCVLKVPTLDDGEVSITLGPGEAVDGHEHTIPGLGMQRLGEPEGSRGDLIVRILVDD